MSAKHRFRSGFRVVAATAIFIGALMNLTSHDRMAGAQSTRENDASVLMAE